MNPLTSVCLRWQTTQVTPEWSTGQRRSWNGSVCSGEGFFLLASLVGLVNTRLWRASYLISPSDACFPVWGLSQLMSRVNHRFDSVTATVFLNLCFQISQNTLLKLTTAFFEVQFIHHTFDSLVFKYICGAYQPLPQSVFEHFHHLRNPIPSNRHTPFFRTLSVPGNHNLLCALMELPVLLLMQWNHPATCLLWLALLTSMCDTFKVYLCWRME